MHDVIVNVTTLFSCVAIVHRTLWTLVAKGSTVLQICKIKICHSNFMKFVQFVFWLKSWCFQAYIVEVIDLANKLQLMIYIFKF
jgi:hypothetical protein